jgi:superfamily II DNA helicase RecQ
MDRKLNLRLTIERIVPCCDRVVCMTSSQSLKLLYRDEVHVVVKFGRMFKSDFQNLLVLLQITNRDLLFSSVM